MSISSINNGSQANSDVETVSAAVPTVHFAVEALTVSILSLSSNPDGRHQHHRCCDQQAMRRFQQAISIEVEFSNEFTVSMILP